MGARPRSILYMEWIHNYLTVTHALTQYCSMESVCKWLSQGTRCSAPTPQPLLETLPTQTPYTVPLVSAGIPHLTWLLKVLAANRRLYYFNFLLKLEKTKQERFGSQLKRLAQYGTPNKELGPWVPQVCLNLDSRQNAVWRRFIWGYESYKHWQNK